MTPEQVQWIIDSIIGSCDTLDQHVDVDLLTRDNFEQIDEQIFYCTQCGWWCPVDEMGEDATEAAGEPVCTDCENGYT